VADVWQLPLVVLICNNQWAISVRRSAQSAAQTLAQKAISAGVPGEQVDGNDVIGVHACVTRALARARAGGGTSLIEAVTYRLSDHTTADDARRYRHDVEVSVHWHGEPVALLRQYLVSQGVWNRDHEEQTLARAAAEIDRVAEVYLATPPQPISAMFRDHSWHDLRKSNAFIIPPARRR